MTTTRAIFRIAKKEHYCINCGALINQHDKYLELSGDDMFNHWTVRKCLLCAQYKRKKINDI